MTGMKRRLDAGVEVLRFAARGMSGPEIARQMYLSEDAVKSRLRFVYTHLGARNMTHAVVLAALAGLLTPEDLQAARDARKEG